MYLNFPVASQFYQSVSSSHSTCVVSSQTRLLPIVIALVLLGIASNLFIARGGYVIP